MANTDPKVQKNVEKAKLDQTLILIGRGADDAWIELGNV
jgi:hypothetical protein